MRTFLGSVDDLAASGAAPFDAFLCFGGNLGLLASREAAGKFLGSLRALAAPSARLVGTLIDPYLTDNQVHLAYHAANRAAGRLSGTVRIRVRYQRSTTPWFELLWASLEELGEVAAEHRWQVTAHFAPGGPIYAAELSPL